MDVLGKLKTWFSSSNQSGFDTEASIDLDIFEAHDEASKNLVGIDFSRLERRNRDRRKSLHQADGDLHIEDDNLRWTPHRTERACGVRVIEFRKEDLRAIERKTGAIVAVLRDGTNIPFVVSTQGATKARRGIPRPRASGQEPPLIS